MKKKLVLTIGSVAAAGVLGFGLFHSSASEIESTMSTEEIKAMVTKQYPGEITEIERETEFNRAIYEVEITGDQKEYDLKLDGNTGEVLDIKEKPVKKPTKAIKEDKIDKKEEGTSSDKDIKITEKESEKSNTKKAEKSSSEKKTKEEKKAVISIGKAKEIALAEFSGEINDIELDEEDGRLIYEVEVERGDKEAEMEIDAYTGEIIVIEIDED